MMRTITIMTEMMIIREHFKAKEDAKTEAVESLKESLQLVFSVCSRLQDACRFNYCLCSFHMLLMFR